jgi:hypothetical protein
MVEASGVHADALLGAVPVAVWVSVAPEQDLVLFCVKVVPAHTVFVEGVHADQVSGLVPVAFCVSTVLVHPNTLV